MAAGLTVKQSVIFIEVTWPFNILQRSSSQGCTPPLTMATTIAINFMQTADGYRLVPISLSIYFYENVRTKVFPQAIVSWHLKLLSTY